jgi:nucleotide-binding universal stress UspA family protein
MHSPAKRQPATMRILVATAGEPESFGALVVASELARLRKAEVLALGVATPFPHAVSSFVSVKPAFATDEDSRLDVLANLRDQVARVPSTDRWIKRAAIGSPSDVINEAAEEWKASLIVMGIGRHSRVDRLFGTETAVAVMKRARIPVLAVKPSARELPKRACAAVDFSPASIAAATLAAKLLAADGTLTLVHGSAFRGVKANAGDLIDLYRAGARAKLDAALAEVRRHTRRRVESIMLEGEPSEAVLGHARRTRCDLISLGGDKRSLMERVLLGSIRTRVLRGASCSVLIAPPD